MKNIDRIKSDVDSVKDFYGKIDSVHENNLKTSFELNGKVKEGLSDLENKRIQLRDMIGDIVSSFFCENRSYVEKELTIRDDGIYVYNSSKKAELSDIVSEPQMRHLKETVNKKIEDDSIFAELCNALDLCRFANYICTEIDYLSLCKAEYIPKEYDYKSKTHKMSDNYYIIYRPKRSHSKGINIFYDYKMSSLAALEKEERCSYGGRNTYINRDDDKKMEDYLKNIWHSKALEKIIRESLTKIEEAIKIIDSAIEEITSDFSKVLVSKSI